jgi:hypothetical protein
MFRKIAFGLVWFVVIYFGTCMVLGGIAGWNAGTEDPARAYEAGGDAAERFLEPLTGYIMLGSLLAAVLGSATGFLPGTRKKNSAHAAGAPREEPGDEA